MDQHVHDSNLQQALDIVGLSLDNATNIIVQGIQIRGVKEEEEGKCHDIDPPQYITHMNLVCITAGTSI